MSFEMLVREYSALAVSISTHVDVDFDFDLFINSSSPSSLLKQTIASVTQGE